GDLTAKATKVKYMGNPTFWEFDEQRVLRNDMTKYWTWAEYDEAIDEAFAQIAHVENRVDLVLNLLAGPHMPLDYVFTHLQRTMHLLPQNTGFLVVVGGSYTSNMLFSVFSRSSQVAQRKLMFAASLEQARSTLIQAQKQHIDERITPSRRRSLPLS